MDGAAPCSDEGIGKIVRLLLEKGADVEVQDKHGQRCVKNGFWIKTGFWEFRTFFNIALAGNFVKYTANYIGLSPGLLINVHRSTM
jgi:hypothetical protein